MKKISLMFLTFLLLPGFLAAQGTKIKEELVPESVLKGYHDKYKKRHVKAWYEDEHGYSAIFEKGDLKPQAYFKNDGTWVRTTLKIKDAAVGSQVKKAIRNTEWSNWKVAQRYRIETPEYPKLFELHLKKGKEKKILLFDPTGKALEIN